MQKHSPAKTSPVAASSATRFPFPAANDVLSRDDWASPTVRSGARSLNEDSFNMLFSRSRCHSLNPLKLSKAKILAIEIAPARNQQTPRFSEVAAATHRITLRWPHCGIPGNGRCRWRHGAGGTNRPYSSAKACDRRKNHPWAPARRSRSRQPSDSLPSSPTPWATSKAPPGVSIRCASDKGTSSNGIEA